MLVRILVLCIFLLSCKSNPKRLDCVRFKTGSFDLRLKSNTGTISFTIFRNNTIQTEINDRTSDTTKYRIIWRDDCTYLLKFLRTTESLSDSLLRLKKSMTITTSFVETANDYYLFQSKSDKSDYLYEDTIWVKK